MARLSQSIAILTKLQVSCIFILLTTVIPNVEARTHNLTWKVTYEYKYLDCFKKLAIAINGQTPGPHIKATRGDTIIVTVLNNLLMENVAIHWHGIRQVACLLARVSTFFLQYCFSFLIYFQVTINTLQNLNTGMRAAW
jgi:hypothetical protein